MVILHIIVVKLPKIAKGARDYETPTLIRLYILILPKKSELGGNRLVIMVKCP